MNSSLPARRCLLFAAVFALLIVAFPAFAQQQPWMNSQLSPDARADLVLKEMTLDEKIDLLHGNGMPGWAKPRPNAYLGNGGAGYVLGVHRLGIPMIQMSDAAYGVRSSARKWTLLHRAALESGCCGQLGPAGRLRLRRTDRPRSSRAGLQHDPGWRHELTREPRNGRTFEYMGEDPILAGTLVGNRMKCEQAQHVIGDIKHYAVNDQESGRNEVNVIIGKRALHESDLLPSRLASPSPIPLPSCAPTTL